MGDTLMCNNYGLYYGFGKSIMGTNVVYLLKLG